MFGSTPNTTDLMLPILLDMANLIRRAVRPGKETREVIQPYPPQLLRRYAEDRDILARQRIEQNTGPVKTPPRLLRRSDTEENIYDSNPTAQTRKYTEGLTGEARKIQSTPFSKLHHEKDTNEPSTAQMLRRSFTEDIDDDMFELGVEPAPTQSPKERLRRIIPQTQRNTITTPIDKDTNNTKHVNIRENSNITNEVDNVSSDLILANFIIKELEYKME